MNATEHETPEAAPAAPIDLTRFCGDDCRFDMTAPFVSGGWRYATDARIAVRVPAPGEPDTVTLEGHGKLPPMAGVFGPASGAYEPWPVGGQVKQIADCPQCHGCGTVGCEECREEACLHCDGRKRFEQVVGRRVGRHLIADRYDKLIRDLPGVQYLAGVDPTAGEGRSLRPVTLPFRFDGGEGRVMGLREPDQSGE